MENSSSWPWVSEMEEELKEVAQNGADELNRWKETSIYRIPSSQRSASKEVYEPQMVAMGPYHHGEEHLKGMERHKKRALLRFLQRSGKSLECYARALSQSLQRLKNAYDDLQQVRDPDFLKMMVLDGCFMLELMRSSTKAEPRSAYAYEGEDPVFSEHGQLYVIPHLMRDMLMLQNQIPLLVLAKLVDAEAVWTQQRLTTCILDFFDPEHDQISNIDELGSCCHVLDLYRKSLLLGTEPKPRRASRCERVVVGVLGSCTKKQSENEKGKKPYKLKSATELMEAWIGLEKSATSCLDDVAFNDWDLILRLPRMKVDDATRHLYLNLMAFERFHVGAGNQVTSYVFFMDKLIDTAEDVSLLHKQEILENLLSSDKEAAELFNSLSKDICPDHSSATPIYDVQERVAAHCSKPLPKFMAYAQHTYFANPWITLSIFAAIFISALTIVQTVYAVLDYHSKK